MKKLFVIAFALMSSFTSAFAGDDHHNLELARDTESDSGNGGEGGLVCNMFFSICGKYYEYYSNRMLTSREFNYLQGWYDALCDKEQLQTV